MSIHSVAGKAPYYDENSKGIFYGVVSAFLIPPPCGSLLRRNLQSKFQGGGKGVITPKILRFSGNPEGGKPKAFEESIFRKMRTLAVILICKACPRISGFP